MIVRQSYCDVRQALQAIAKVFVFGSRRKIAWTNQRFIEGVFVFLLCQLLIFVPVVYTDLCGNKNLPTHIFLWKCERIYSTLLLKAETYNTLEI